MSAEISDDLYCSRLDIIVSNILQETSYLFWRHVLGKVLRT